jgi:hypothetical protein
MRFPCNEGSLVELPSESVTSLNAVLSEAVPHILDWFPKVVTDLYLDYAFLSCERGIYIF